MMRIREGRRMRIRSNNLLFLSVTIIGVTFLLYNFYKTPPLISFPPQISLTPTNICDVRPRLAYYISGSYGDGERLKRILQAVYHPYNTYILHLDKAASLIEHQELSNYIDTHKVFSSAGNVKMIGGPQVVHDKKLTYVANVLHAADILLKDKEWDWFMNLDASDYPLVTQDDLLYALSCMPRHLNFIDHFHIRDLSWRQDDVSDFWKKVMQILNISWRRHFELFEGSPWMALSRPFVRDCKWTWDNLLQPVYFMDDEAHYVGSIYSSDDFFQSLLCKSQVFSKTVVNTDLRFTARDDSIEENPRYITKDDLMPMFESNAPFARMFNESGGGSTVLDFIDRILLHREANMLVPGGWCFLRHDPMSSHHCLEVGNITKLHLGSGVNRLQQFLKGYYNGTMLSSQCEVKM